MANNHKVTQQGLINYLYRNSVNGQTVSKQYALLHPDTTEKETFKRPKK